MKSFKLIKEYPGCSELGRIVHLFGDVYRESKTIGGFFVKSDIETYPEFWEQL